MPEGDGGPGAGREGEWPEGAGAGDHGNGARPGLRFTEHMEGYFADVVDPRGGFRQGQEVGRRSGQAMSTWLTITYHDLPAPVGGPCHAGHHHRVDRRPLAG